MKYLLIDVINNKVEMVEADGLDDFYRILNCRCIDIIHRKIGDTECTLIIDDEGLLKDDPIVSAIDVTGLPCLVGNILIASDRTVDGELTELTNEEVQDIMFNVAEITTLKRSEPYRVLVEVDY